MASAVSTSSPVRDSVSNSYTLEGGVIVHDKTNGIAKAVFSAELRDKYKASSAHEIIIKDKKVVVPIFPEDLRMNLLFTNSVSIKFSPKNEFIKIKEVDSKSSTVLYVDPNRLVADKAYMAFSYIPEEISEEVAMKKIETLKTDFPSFAGDIAIYNRHGVAVFGWDNNDRRYSLYWANPHEEKVKKVDCLDCSRYRDGGTSIAKSHDGFVHFQYLFGKGYYLNTEPAKALSLKK